MDSKDCKILRNIDRLGFKAQLQEELLPPSSVDQLDCVLPRVADNHASVSTSDRPILVCFLVFTGPCRTL